MLLLNRLILIRLLAHFRPLSPSGRAFVNPLSSSTDLKFTRFDKFLK